MTKVRIVLQLQNCVRNQAINQNESENLRNTNGIPPRIAFFPSNTANLLEYNENSKG